MRKKSSPSTTVGDAFHNLRNRLNSIFMTLAVLRSRNQRGESVDLEEKIEVLLRNAREARDLISRIERLTVDDEQEEGVSRKK